MKFADHVRSTLLACALAALSGCAPLNIPPGEPVAVPRLHRAHFVAADRAVLPVRAWLPPGGSERAVLVALHGFNDYSRFFAAAGAFLSQRGIACYAYDQRGFGHAPSHGLWAGAAAYAQDLSDFTREIRRRYPGAPVYLLGESMGGAVAIAAMTGPNPPPVDGLILSAPAVWTRNTMPWYQTLLLDSAARVVPDFRLTGEGLGILPSDNIDMLRALGRDPLVIKATRVDAVYGLTELMDEAAALFPRLKPSTLLLYGERDQIVPRQSVFRMLERAPANSPVRVAFYEHGYHLLLRDLEAEKPWGDIAAWIADRSAPLPSGADKRLPEGFHGPLPVLRAGRGHGNGAG